MHACIHISYNYILYNSRVIVVRSRWRRRRRRRKGGEKVKWDDDDDTFLLLLFPCYTSVVMTFFRPDLTKNSRYILLLDQLSLWLRSVCAAEKHLPCLHCTSTMSGSVRKDFSLSLFFFSPFFSFRSHAAAAAASGTMRAQGDSAACCFAILLSALLYIYIYTSTYYTICAIIHIGAKVNY